MSAGLREKLATLSKGAMSNIFGQVPANGIVPILILPSAGLDWVIVSRLDMAGVNTAGSVTYTMGNGAQVEAGYAANGSVDCMIPSKTQVALTIDNNQTTTVYYNLILIGLTDLDYQCSVVNTL